MFARTPRLLLRPGWTEDAPALAHAIGTEQVVRNLSTAPWPYAVGDAEAFLAAPRDPVLPTFLIFARTNGSPELIGSCGLARRASACIELGTWITRSHWGRGYATEAGQALIEIARMLAIGQLDSSHFVDNPASGRVLEKLGFVPTGIVAPRHSCARGGEAPTRLFKLDLRSQPIEALAA